MFVFNVTTASKLFDWHKTNAEAFKISLFNCDINSTEFAHIAGKCGKTLANQSRKSGCQFVRDTVGCL